MPSHPPIFVPELPIVWETNGIGPWFAYAGGVDVGAASTTAREGVWLSQVRTGPEWRDRLHCYATSERRAKYFVERWLKHHMVDVEAVAEHRRLERLQQAAARPMRKPKGLDDRS